MTSKPPEFNTYSPGMFVVLLLFGLGLVMATPFLSIHMYIQAASLILGLSLIKIALNYRETGGGD